MNKIGKVGALFGAAIVSSILAGCVSVSQEMTPQSVDVVRRFEKTVCVVPTSVDKPIPLPGYDSYTRANCFGPALEVAMNTFGPFARVVSEKEADYRLEVYESHLSPPPLNFFALNNFDDITIGNDMLWTLKSTKSDKPIWQENIHGRYTATISDSFFSWVALVRFRHANTGVARVNLKMGLEKISALPLP